MPPAPARSAARTWWPAFLAAAIAVAANLWTLRLGFIQDDFPLVSRVAENFVPEPWLGADPCSGDRVWFHEEGHPVPGRFMFRVTAWALWWLLVHGAGGMASAPVFHAALLAIHAMSTFLLCRLLLRLTNVSAATIASIVFAIEPGSSQALTWAAAAGDLLSVLFLILSALFVQKRCESGRLSSDVLAGVSFALACGAKESAAFFGPAVLLVLLANRSAARKAPLWRLVLCFAVPLALLVIARRAYTGEWIPSIPPSQLRKYHATAMEFLAQALAPWQPTLGEGDPISVALLRESAGRDLRFTVRMIGVLVVLLPCLVGLLVRPRWLAIRLAALGAAGAIGMVPIARILLVQNQVVDTNALGRAAHPFFPLIAAAIAFSLFALRHRSRWLRIGVVLPLLLWQVDFLVHVASIEHARSEGVRQRLASFARLVEAGPPGARYVAIDPEYSLGVGIEHAFKPPFFPKDVPVTWIPRDDHDILSRLPCVFAHAGPIVLAGVENGSFVARGAPMPALPGSVPPLARVEAGGETIFRFPAPVPARALPALRVRVGLDAEGGSLPWAVEFAEPPAVEWRTQKLAVPPGEIATIILEPSDAIVERRRVAGIRFGGKARVDGIPAVLPRVPEILLSVPVSADGAVPMVAWETVPDAATHKVELRIRVGGPTDTATAVIEPAESKIRESGLSRRLVLEPDMGVTWHDQTLLWGHIMPWVFSAAKGKDLHAIAVEFRITASDRHGAIAGRSEWRTVYVTVPD